MGIVEVAGIVCTVADGKNIAVGIKVEVQAIPLQLTAKMDIVPTWDGTKTRVRRTAVKTVFPRFFVTQIEENKNGFQYKFVQGLEHLH